MTENREATMRHTAILLGVSALLLTSGCTQGGLDPRGGEAARIYWVFWALLIAGGVVSVIVLVLWIVGSLRPGAGDARAEHVPDPAFHRRLVVGGGIIMPAIVVSAFLGVQIVTTSAQTQDGELTIEVTGHQYWWELEYTDVDGLEPFETANELHIPTGTPVRVLLRSEDVIHSIWVPQLAGKVDLVPGRETEFVMDAEEPGTYAGYCAEFCGLQHARMKFSVVATEPGAFRAWAEEQAGAAPEPETELESRGREVFLGQSCVGCHTIRGVAEDGEIGPDLTRLASRSRIAAGTVPLTDERLRAWVANAQAIKPGVQMPPQELDREELDALVAYLLSLE